MNCVLGSAIWPVLLHLNNYCIRNVKHQNMFSNYWKKNHLTTTVAMWELCVIPCRLLGISVQEHIHTWAWAAVFLRVFNPSLMTLLEHWSGCKEQSGSGWFLWRAKSGVCVWYLMMGQFLGWPTLWYWSWLLPWKQHLNLSLLLAPHSSALLSGKDQF